MLETDKHELTPSPSITSALSSESLAGLHTSGLNQDECPLLFQGQSPSGSRCISAGANTGALRVWACPGHLLCRISGTAATGLWTPLLGQSEGLGSQSTLSSLPSTTSRFPP